MTNRIAIQEVHGGSLERDDHVRDESHVLLIDDRMRRRRRKCLARNCVEVDRNGARGLHPLCGYLALDFGSGYIRHKDERKKKCPQYDAITFHSCLLIVKSCSRCRRLDRWGGRIVPPRRYFVASSFD